MGKVCHDRATCAERKEVVKQEYFYERTAQAPASSLQLVLSSLRPTMLPFHLLSNVFPNLYSLWTRDPALLLFCPCRLASPLGLVKPRGRCYRLYRSLSDLKVLASSLTKLGKATSLTSVRLQLNGLAKYFVFAQIKLGYIYMFHGKSRAKELRLLNNHIGFWMKMECWWKTVAAVRKVSVLQRQSTATHFIG